MQITLRYKGIKELGEGYKEYNFELKDSSNVHRATIHCAEYAAHIASSLSKEPIDHVRDEIQKVMMLGTGARVRFGR